ncbi:3-oxoacyl-ACP synthase [Chitinophaga pinensis]|uniref:3-Oxoacyl-(Acyl-carrier-protein (ACP)) synthase III domain protein n=1 Tax=Chitinophaga pinensis (strain ATCC 43595 / DSM 2588 / LMG 13176 / NBRC 15968 / NCIMB 11800 / UQM 2034) TaxID=485918 RepID=A0A979G515_CHIPD|nr:3-oxoacyl-ACP synthase [Chitinophaga pinensis]ACU60881.1 3-Oxoacyl-(acyl-carrier-protein (ACP)) synthase III domain protein [Chitinophaga pinensis DSM 2588]
MIGINQIATVIIGDKTPVSSLLNAGTLKKEEHEYFAGAGINSVYNATAHSAYDLAKQAAVKVLDQSGVPAADIGLIVYIHSRLPEYLVSSQAGRLQHDLQARNAVFFSLSDLGCADISMALQLAQVYMQGNTQIKHALICYGNKPYAPSRFRYPVTINGDAGIALLLSRTEKNRILDIKIKTNGRYWNLFKVDYKDKSFAEFREECASIRSYAFELALESRNEFVKLNNDLLETNGLAKPDVSHFMMQNLSMRAFAYYEEALGIRISDVCRENLTELGHLGPGDIICNYARALEQDLVRPGEHVLLMNNSPVAVWSSILLKA